MLYVVICAFPTIHGQYFPLFPTCHASLIHINVYVALPFCIVCCYSARKALGQCLPDQLRDGTFTQCLQDDKSTKQWLQMLIKNLELGATQQPGADPRQMGMSPLGS